MSLSVDDMTLWLKDPKASAREHLTLINTFSKVARHKISI